MRIYRTGKENLITREELLGNPAGQNGQSVEWECGCTLNIRCEKHTGSGIPEFKRLTVFGYGDGAVGITSDYAREQGINVRSPLVGDLEKFLINRNLI